MKFLADESVDFPIVKLMRNLGYDIEAIMEFSAGIPDTEVLKIANEKEAVLITMDKDFGELVYRNKHNAFGIVLLRINHLESDKQLSIINQLLDKYVDELLGRFTVVQENNIRIRTI
jgi:predicted nuclease of predicted toxin-antitoxin system